MSVKFDAQKLEILMILQHIAKFVGQGIGTRPSRVGFRY